MKLRIPVLFLLAICLLSFVVESLATNANETETELETEAEREAETEIAEAEGDAEERKFKLKKLKKKIIKPLLKPSVIPIPIPVPVPDLSNKPQFTLPSIDNLDFNFEKPSIPTPTLSPEVLDIKYTISNIFTELLSLKNRFPNAVAQIGNFSLMQAVLLFAFGGLLIGTALFLAEAWVFKSEEEDKFNFDHLFKFGNMDMLDAPQYGAPQYGTPQYGAPPSQGYSGGYSSQRRRQYKEAPSAALPQYYGINVDSKNYYSGLQNRQSSAGGGSQTDPLMYYNYGNAKQGENPESAAAPASQGFFKDFVSRFWNFPTFNKDKKKKIMFG